MLFFGYEKKFKSNTIKFKESVNSFVMEMHERQNYGTMAFLNVILRLLDKVECPAKANAKQQAAIDERISALIEDMSRLCRAGKDVEFAKCAEILKEAIYDSRKHGSELYTDEQLKIKRSQAALSGKIDDSLNAQAKLESEMKELLAKSASLREGSAEYIRVETKYNECDKKVKQLKEIVALSVNAYNANLSSISVGDQIDEMEMIKDAMVQSPQAFAERAEELNSKKAKFLEETSLFEDVDNTLYSVSEAESKSNKQSAFKNAVNAEKDRELDKAFSELKFEEKAETVSPFRQALKNDN